MPRNFACLAFCFSLALSSMSLHHSLFLLQCDYFAKMIVYSYMNEFNLQSTRCALIHVYVCAIAEKYVQHGLKLNSIYIQRKKRVGAKSLRESCFFSLPFHLNESSKLNGTFICKMLIMNIILVIKIRFCTPFKIDSEYPN